MWVFFFILCTQEENGGQVGLVFKRKWILLLLFLPSYLPPEKVLWERERPKLMSIFFTLVCACVCVCLGPTIIVVYSCWASDTIYSFFSFHLLNRRSYFPGRPTVFFFFFLLFSVVNHPNDIKTNCSLSLLSFSPLKLGEETFFRTRINHLTLILLPSSPLRT